jgi:hypothetical protein
VKTVSSSQLDHEILSEAQVFEVRAIYKSVSKDPAKELKRKDLLVVTGRQEDEDLGNDLKN